MGKPTVIFVAAMGEIHPHHVKAGLTELVDRLNGVGLGTNGADNGRPAQVALRRDLGVKRSQPFNLAAEAEVVESGRHSDGYVKSLGEVVSVGSDRDRKRSWAARKAKKKKKKIKGKKRF